MSTPEQDFSSESSRSSAQSPTPAPGSASTSALTAIVPGRRASTLGRSGHTCPDCDAPFKLGQSTCLACGRRLRKLPEVIRCRHCNQVASSELILCPDCGRQLIPAPSRLLTWGLPALVAVLLVGVVLAQVGIVSTPVWPFLNNGLAAIENVAITPVVRSQAASSQGEDGQPSDHTGEQSDEREGNGIVALQPLAPATPTASSEPTSGATVITSTVDVAENERDVESALTDDFDQSAPRNDENTTRVESDSIEQEAQQDRNGPEGDDDRVDVPTGEEDVTDPSSIDTQQPTQAGVDSSSAPTTVSTAQEETETPSPSSTLTPSDTEPDSSTGPSTRQPAATSNAIPEATGTASPEAATPTTSTIASDDGSIQARSLSATETEDTPPAQSDDDADSDDALNAEETRTSSSQSASDDSNQPPSDGSDSESTSETDLPDVETPSDATAPDPTPTSAITGSYTVRTGDTLVGIASRFDLSIGDLLQANNVSSLDAARIQPGRVLVLPGVIGPNDERVQTYVARSGDTLVGIALRFNVSSRALLQANGLTAQDAGSLQVGQVLVIPADGSSGTTTPVQSASTGGPTPTPAIQEYTVRTGDTVVGLAIRFDISTEAILDANDLDENDARDLHPGDVLMLPLAGEPTPTTLAAESVSSSGTTMLSSTIESATGQMSGSQSLTFRLNPPRLTTPLDGVTIQCNATAQYLQWSEVEDTTSGDAYVLFLGYSDEQTDEQTSDSDEQSVTWLPRQQTGQRTSWRLNPDYCNGASTSEGNPLDIQWQWYVQIFNGETAVSPPSEIRSFLWQ